MKLCRFNRNNDLPRVGLLSGDGKAVLDLTEAGVRRLDTVLERYDRFAFLDDLRRHPLPQLPISQISLLAPVDQQEVWAAGVTYVRSKIARMEESEFSANAYDRVYDAARPELFFKALPHKVVHPGEPVGIRQDATWNVPEPELVLVISSTGELAGYTLGNDMSSRDIEGENLLYLPQAKVYDRSCAVGPFVRIGVDETEVRQWKIQLEVRRRADVVFAADTALSQIKRTFSELIQYLRRSQTFPHGAMLLTGTGIVPGDDFSLQPGDTVRIECDGIGSMTHPVCVV